MFWSIFAVLLDTSGAERGLCLEMLIGKLSAYQCFLKLSPDEITPGMGRENLRQPDGQPAKKTEQEQLMRQEIQEGMVS